MSTPVGFLLGIVKAAAKRTDHALPPHLTPLTEGREVTAFADLEQALENAGQRLTNDQCACLRTSQRAGVGAPPENIFRDRSFSPAPDAP